MAKLLYLFVALSTLAYVSANFQSSLNIESAEGTEPFATSLSQWLVDTISRKIVTLARFFNLKLRLVRFLVSLVTPENLVLFRNILEEAVRLGTFTLRLLPESVEDPVYWWVPAVSQFINISVGGESGPVAASAAPEAPEAAGSEVSEIVTNPPIFFNVPPSSTETPTADSTDAVDDDLDVRGKPAATAAPAAEATPAAAATAAAVQEEIMAQTVAGMTEDERQRLTEEILKKYEDNVISLDKLINGPRNN